MVNVLEASIIFIDDIYDFHPIWKTLGPMRGSYLLIFRGNVSCQGKALCLSVHPSEVISYLCARELIDGKDDISF